MMFIAPGVPITKVVHCAKSPPLKKQLIAKKLQINSCKKGWEGARARYTNFSWRSSLLLTISCNCCCFLRKCTGILVGVCYMNK